MEGKIEAVSYSSLYGYLPAGSAFDTAVAALSLREDRIFAVSKDLIGASPFRMIEEESEALYAIETEWCF